MGFALPGGERDLAFPEEEYRQRMAAVRQRMREREIDALLVHHPLNVLYLSGFQSINMYDSECFILPLEGESALLVPERELGGALLYSWIESPTIFRRTEYPDTTFRQPMQAAADALAAMGVNRSRIGVERRSMALAAQKYDTLKGLLPDADLVDVSGLVDGIKARKSPREIEHLRRAAEMSSLGMRAAIGARPRENGQRHSRGRLFHDDERRQRVPLAGADRHRRSPRRDHPLHPSPRAAQAGRGRQYRSRRLLPALYGAGHAHDRDRHAKSLRQKTRQRLPDRPQQRSGGDAPRRDRGRRCPLRYGGDQPGRRQRHLPRLLRLFGRRLVSTCLGGRRVSLFLDQQTRLEPGMVFHIPMGLRILEECGAMFSETVLITEDGCEVLTDVERVLHEIAA